MGEETKVEIARVVADSISSYRKEIGRIIVSMVAIFGIALLSGIFWAGGINNAVNSVSDDVDEIKQILKEYTYDANAKIDKIEDQVYELSIIVGRNYGALERSGLVKKSSSNITEKLDKYE